MGRLLEDAARVLQPARGAEIRAPVPGPREEVGETGQGGQAFRPGIGQAVRGERSRREVADGEPDRDRERDAGRDEVLPSLLEGRLAVRRPRADLVEVGARDLVPFDEGRAELEDPALQGRGALQEPEPLLRGREVPVGERRRVDGGRSGLREALERGFGIQAGGLLAFAVYFPGWPSPPRAA